jgi:hypothetical protein
MWYGIVLAHKEERRDCKYPVWRRKARHHMRSEEDVGRREGTADAPAQTRDQQAAV